MKNFAQISFVYATLLLFVSLAVKAQVSINGSEISDTAKRILIEIMNNSEVKSVTITSTNRTINHQVNVMFGWIQRHSVDEAFALYGPEGDAVVKAYKAGIEKDLKEEDIKAGMVEVLKQQMPSAIENNRLMHVGREDLYEVFDISISSMKPENKFEEFQEEARKLMSTGKIHRFLGQGEGEKEAFHFELKK